MKKTNLFAGLIMAFAASVIVLTSCNKTDNKTDEKSSQKQENSEMKIAFVEIDSIMTQYNFCKDYAKILEQKNQNIQKTLADKGKALQNAAMKFQQDIQQNKYTREEAERVQSNLQKQDNDLQILQQRLFGELQSETDKYNTALRDSIQHYLAKYNKNKKFTFILSKAGDNMLYADKKLDITDEIIAGLNKAYKGTSKKNEEKKSTKK